MIDRDLAEMYGVETRILNQSVRRNIKRFPEDFMFQLTIEEMKNWISQTVISSIESSERIDFVPEYSGQAHFLVPSTRGEELQYI